MFIAVHFSLVQEPGFYGLVHPDQVNRLSFNTQKLLLVTTGNIINRDLLILFEKYFDTIIQLFDRYDLIELDNNQIIGHEK